jgi:hypothetical protein
MSITVRADVVDGVQPPDVTNQIWPQLKPLSDKSNWIPPEVGGAIEESEKTARSLPFPLMLIAMLTILMIQLQSFSHDPGSAHRAARAGFGRSRSTCQQTLRLRPCRPRAAGRSRNAVILVDQIESDAERGPQAQRSHRGSDRAPRAPVA